MWHYVPSIILFILLLVAAFGPDNRTRFILSLLCYAIALLVSWIVAGRPGYFDGAFGIMLGQVTIASICGILLGRIAWSIKSGDPILS